LGIKFSGKYLAQTEERAGGWRKFHNSQILNLYISLKVKHSMEEEGM
jgi:hypothetical protein